MPLYAIFLFLFIFMAIIIGFGFGCTKMGVSGLLMLLGMLIYVIWGLPSKDYPSGILFATIMGWTIFSGGCFLFIYSIPKLYFSSALSKDANYDKKTCSLYVHSRSKYVFHSLNIVPNMDFNLKYNPSELTYTGVTIGGVTTGNFNFEKESTSILSHKNGTYSLNYGPKNTYAPIDKIILDDSLKTAAKNDPNISVYLSGNTLELNCKNGKALDELENSTIFSLSQEGSLSSLTVAANMLLNNANGKGLSWNECQTIKQWLKGCNNSQKSIVYHEKELETAKSRTKEYNKNSPSAKKTEVEKEIQYLKEQIAHLEARSESVKTNYAIFEVVFGFLAIPMLCVVNTKLIFTLCVFIFAILGISLFIYLRLMQQIKKNIADFKTSLYEQKTKLDEIKKAPSSGKQK